MCLFAYLQHILSSDSYRLFQIDMMAGGGGELPPHLPLTYQQDYSTESFRNPANAPLRKLTVDLIKTYRKINEVGELGGGGEMYFQPQGCSVVIKNVLCPAVMYLFLRALTTYTQIRVCEITGAQMRKFINHNSENVGG